VHRPYYLQLHRPLARCITLCPQCFYCTDQLAVERPSQRPRVFVLVDVQGQSKETQRRWGEALQTARPSLSSDPCSRRPRWSPGERAPHSRWSRPLSVNTMGWNLAPHSSPIFDLAHSAVGIIRLRPRTSNFTCFSDSADCEDRFPAPAMPRRIYTSSLSSVTFTER
jgi:hypothetical protein